MNPNPLFPSKSKYKASQDASQIQDGVTNLLIHAANTSNALHKQLFAGSPEEVQDRLDVFGEPALTALFAANKAVAAQVNSLIERMEISIQPMKVETGVELDLVEGRYIVKPQTGENETV